MNLATLQATDHFGDVGYLDLIDMARQAMELPQYHALGYCDIEWALEAVEAVVNGSVGTTSRQLLALAEHRFHERSTNHLLSALRCIRTAHRRLERLQATEEAAADPRQLRPAAASRGNKRGAKSAKHLADQANNRAWETDNKVRK